MKSAVLLLAFAATATAGVAPKGATPSLAQVTFHVTADTGAPVPGVAVDLEGFPNLDPNVKLGVNVQKKIHGTTDRNGRVTLQIPSFGEVAYTIAQLKGWYPSPNGTLTFANETTGRWQPWNQTVEIVLRQILQPIPMYARLVSAPVPSQATEFGYDLLAGDFVASNHAGKVADFVVSFTRTVNGPSVNNVITIGFSNSGDGIQPYPAGEYYMDQVFRSPRYAPEQGYTSPLVEKSGRTLTGSPRRGPPPGDRLGNRTLPISPPNGGGRGEDRSYIFENSEIPGYVFRIRTELDDQGKVKSALYGKLTRRFNINTGAADTDYRVLFEYYLNPTPNDRNLEFDPKKNLFPNSGNMTFAP